MNALRTTFRDLGRRLAWLGVGASTGAARGSTPCACAVAVVLALLVTLTGARAAQPDGAGTPGDGSAAGAGASGAGGGGGPALVAGTGEVRVEIDRFGVGGVVRPGEWVGLRVRVLDSSVRQRDALVRVHIEDIDGDRAVYERPLTTNPGAWQSAWVYVRLPFGFSPSGTLAVSVHEAEEVEAGAPEDGGVRGVRPGRLLARVNAPPASVAFPQTGLALVVGQRAMGLKQYAARVGNEAFAPLGHELLDTVTLGGAAEIPDRWMGLAQYGLLVWQQGDPTELRGERAQAVREWINRGGHLVVVLPQAGQTWTDPRSNELYDLLPAVAVTRREGVDLEAYRNLLTHAERRRARPPALPREAVVHTFEPLAGARPGEAVRLMTGPDGLCVVARRVVGSGAVTLVGLDLAAGALAAQELPDADVFWHRVLGRRGILLSGGELQTLGTTRFSGIGSRESVALDADIAPLIAKSGRSGLGLLLGLVAFVAYWLVAGPPTYALLKRSGLLRHSWLAFVGAAALFTGIAWSGATLLRPGRLQATHFTVMDHVYGQDLQRARAWVSVLIPEYGAPTISVGEPQETPGSREPVNTIAAWEPYREDLGTAARFPDSRDYAVDARRPSSMAPPARATIKQVQADWLGGPVWVMPQPVTDLVNGAPAPLDPANPPRLVGDPATGRLRGTLVHELPGSLRDVLIIYVQRQATLSRAPSSIGFNSTETTSVATAFALGVDWAPGQRLDLSALRESSRTTAYFLNLFPLRGSGGLPMGAPTGVPSPAGLENRLAALSLFEQLPPPDATPDASSQTLARRAMTHGWGLGRWFTQPCVIVIGHLTEDGGGDGTQADSPVPIFVAGQRAPMRGRTLVRWVYPLDDQPPQWPGAAEETAPAAEGGEGGAGADGVPGAGTGSGGGSGG